MANSLRDLVMFLGVKVDDKELKQLDFTLSDVKKSVEGLAAAWGLFEIGKFIGSQVEAAFQLRRTADMLGTSTDELQAWRHSANLAGESTEKFDRAMRFLLKNQGKAELGMKAATDEFSRWGISAKDSKGQFVPLFERVAQFSDKLVEMKTQSQRTRASMAVFGIAGAQVLPWLLKGSKEVRESLKDFKALGGGFSEDFIEQASKVAVQFRRITTASKGVIDGLLKPIMPLLEHGAKALAEFGGKLADVLKHSMAVQTALRFLAGAAVTLLVVKLVQGALAVWRLIQMMRLLGSVGSLVTFGWVGVAIAAFTALYLIVEDLWVALQGGDSVILKQLQDMLGLKEAKQLLLDIQGAWDGLKNAFKSSLPDLHIIGKALQLMFKDAMPYMTGLIGGAVYGIKGLVDTVLAAGSVLSALKDKATGKATTQDVIAAWEKAKGAIKVDAQGFRRFVTGNQEDTEVYSAASEASAAYPGSKLRATIPSIGFGRQAQQLQDRAFAPPSTTVKVRVENKGKPGDVSVHHDDAPDDVDHWAEVD